MEPHVRYEDERWDGVDLAGSRPRAVELRDMELEKVELTGARLPRWSLRNTRLRECSLANLEAPYSEWNAVELHGCRLTGLDLRDSSGRHVLFADCRADLVSLRSARLEGAVFRDCLLTGADLSGADLRGARFERCDLTEVELREARLEGAVLDGCRLAGVRGALALRGTKMRWDGHPRARGRRSPASSSIELIEMRLLRHRRHRVRSAARWSPTRSPAAHAVTIFHRGCARPATCSRTPSTLLGDRTRDLSALLGREWDAVIDTCGFEPEHVGAAAELLADRAGHYGFVSSGSAYPDSARRRP